jgi:hypothetical protein
MQIDDIDPQKYFPYLTADSVPTVDADDLKTAWSLPAMIAAEHGLPDIALGAGVYAAHLKPGAEVNAITFRIAWLRMTKLMADARKIEFPYFHGDTPDDVVFKAFAKVPMTGFNNGNVPPFDPDELMRIILSDS